MGQNTSDTADKSTNAFDLYPEQNTLQNGDLQLRTDTQDAGKTDDLQKKILSSHKFIGANNFKDNWMMPPPENRKG